MPVLGVRVLEGEGDQGHVGLVVDGELAGLNQPLAQVRRVLHAGLQYRAVPSLAEPELCGQVEWENRGSAPQCVH